MARKDVAFKLCKIGHKGQTVIEYIFMLAIMISIIGSLLTLLKTYYLGDMKKCVPGASTKLILCKIQGYISGEGTGAKKFQYYYFKK